MISSGTLSVHVCRMLYDVLPLRFFHNRQQAYSSIFSKPLSVMTPYRLQHLPFWLQKSIPQSQDSPNANRYIGATIHKYHWCIKGFSFTIDGTSFSIFFENSKNNYIYRYWLLQCRPYNLRHNLPFHPPGAVESLYARYPSHKAPPMTRPHLPTPHWAQDSR